MKKLITILFFVSTVLAETKVCKEFELPPQFSIKKFPELIMKNAHDYIIKSDSLGVDYIDKKANSVISYEFFHKNYNDWFKFNIINYLAACGNSDAMVLASTYYKDNKIKNYWLQRAIKKHNIKAIYFYDKTKNKSDKVAKNLFWLYRNSNKQIIRLKAEALLLSGYKEYIKKNNVVLKDIESNPYAKVKEYYSWNLDIDKIEKLKKINISDSYDTLFSYYLTKDIKVAKKYYYKLLKFEKNNFEQLYPEYSQIVGVLQNNNFTSRALLHLAFNISFIESNKLTEDYFKQKDKKEIGGKYKEFKKKYDTILRGSYNQKVLEKLYSLPPEQLYEYAPKITKNYSKQDYIKFSKIFEDEEEKKIFLTLDNKLKNILIYISKNVQSK